MFQRVLIQQDPFLKSNDTRPWRERGHWPCRWISSTQTSRPPLVSAYRLVFDVESMLETRIHVTADERYELYLDGELMGHGPERGDPSHWFYESFDLRLPAGKHILSARVWSLGELAAEYQMSAHPGFLLAAEGEWQSRLSTGVADWECKILGGYEWISPAPAGWRDWRTRIHGSHFDWGAAERGAGEHWQSAIPLQPAIGRLIDWSFYQQHRLYPATLPAMLHTLRRVGQVRHVDAVTTLDTHTLAVEAATADTSAQSLWQAVIEGKASITLPANRGVRVLIDLQGYYCAFPEIAVSGGAGSQIRLSWAESLRHVPDAYSADKGHRDEIEGKYFTGYGDEFLPDGPARTLVPLWWGSGRYLELVILTNEQPITISDLQWYERRYPIEMESYFSTDDMRLMRSLPLLIRGLQVDAHDAYFDTPYYEEHTYAGDTRLEALVTYVMTRDDRLPRKELTLFDASRLANGFTQSRYPCRVTQVIPAWSLWWIGMLHDYAMWRGDAAFVKALLPGVRATLQGFQRHIGPDGLLYSPEGWNNLDWAPEWDAEGGMPPDAVDGPSAPLNWQLVYALTLAADLEAQVGEAEFAAYNRRWAQELAEASIQAFWDTDRQRFADDLDHGQARRYSEHTQTLAILSGMLDPLRQQQTGEALLHAPHLARASYHFMHYLIEAFRVLKQPQPILERLASWDQRMAARGLKTPLEAFEPSRSDCHAWSSHPLYHDFATVLGIRPASFGFQTVAITPCLGTLANAEGILLHPHGGTIYAQFSQENGSLHGRIELPDGITGKLILPEQEIVLAPGTTTF